MIWQREPRSSARWDYPLNNIHFLANKKRVILNQVITFIYCTERQISLVGNFYKTLSTPIARWLN